MGREKIEPLFAKFNLMYLIDIFFYVKMFYAYYFPAKGLILTQSNS